MSRISRSKSWSRFGSAVLAATMLVSAAVAAQEPQEQTLGVTDDQVIIGSCSPQTGSLKERGQQIVLGGNAYFRYINDQGGVNGRKIKLAVCDDKYDPEAAISCFNTCLKDKVFAGAFFVGSPPITKYVRMGEVNKMPLLGFCTGTPAAYELHPTVFIIRPGYHDEVDHHIDQLWKVLGLRKIAVVYQNDAFGAAVRENVNRSLARFNATPVIEASYSRKTQEIDDAFSRVYAAKPEAVILGATTDALKGFVRKRDEANWNALIAAFSVDTDFLQEMGKQSDNIVLTQVVPPLDDKLPAVALYNKVRRKYEPTAQPNLSSYEAFLNAMVLSEGLKRAGRDLTRDKFVKALESLHNFDLGAGPTVKVSFSATNHAGLGSSAVYFTLMHDGKVMPVTPSDWKSLVANAKAAAK